MRQAETCSDCCSHCNSKQALHSAGMDTYNTAAHIHSYTSTQYLSACPDEGVLKKAKILLDV